MSMQLPDTDIVSLYSEYLELDCRALYTLHPGLGIVTLITLLSLLSSGPSSVSIPLVIF